MKNTILTLFLAVVVNLRCEAQVVYSNLPVSGTGFVTVLPNFQLWQAVSFTTPNYSSLISLVTEVERLSVNGSHAFNVFADNTGTPGAYLFGLQPQGNLYGTPSDVFADRLWTPLSTFTLNPNTTYWIERYSPNGGGATIEWLLSGTTPFGTSGISNYARSTDGTNWSTGTGAPAFSVELAAVPEPSTYAMFAGLGALSLALWRKSRRARDQFPSPRQA